MKQKETYPIFNVIFYTVMIASAYWIYSTYTDRNPPQPKQVVQTREAPKQSATPVQVNPNPPIVKRSNYTKDVAMKEDYLCYAFFDFVEYTGRENNDRDRARQGYNLKAKMTQNYIMTVGGIIDGKSELNFYTGPGNSHKQTELIPKCLAKVNG